MKRISRILLASALMLALVFSLASCKNVKNSKGNELFPIKHEISKNSTPAEYIVGAVEKTLNAKAKTSLASVMTEAASCGSIALEYANSDNNPMIPLDSAAIKVFVGGSDKLAINGELGIEGKKLDIKGYYNNSVLAVGSNALVGENMYGIDLKTAKDNFKNSFIASEPGASELFGENGELFDYILGMSKETEKLTKIYDGYIDALIESLNKNATASIESVDGGKSVIVELNADSLKKIITDMFNKLKNDTELREFLTTYKSYLDSIGSISNSGEFPVDIAAQLDEALTDEKLNELLSELDGLGFSVKLTVTTDKNDMLKKLELYLEGASDSDQKDTVLVVCDLTKADEKTINVKLSGANVNQEFSIILKVLTDNADEYKASLSVALGQVSVNDVIRVELDRKNGKYKVATNISNLIGEKASDENGVAGIVYNDIEISGTIDVKENTYFSFSIDEVKASDETVKVGLKMTVNAKDTMPAISNSFVDILTLTEEDFTKLGEDIMKNAAENGFDSIFGGNGDIGLVDITVE